ncbi:MAG TPA: hypothetical protein VIM06_06640 [Rhodanobacter sp.]
MRKMIRASTACAFVLVLTGCQSGLMMKSRGAGEMVSPNEALVVFLRPASFGGASHSSVYDVPAARPRSAASSRPGRK